MNKKDLAELSCLQEMIYLKKSSGKQDQYAAVYGGLKSMKINLEGKVKINSINIKEKYFKEFKNNILLYYSNIFRSANLVLKNQSSNILKNNSTKEYMKEIQKIGMYSYQSIINNDFDEFGKLLDIHFNLKRKTSNLMTNKKLNQIYDYSKKIGSLGGKLVGAGGGGVFMFYVPKKNQKLFRTKMISTRMKELKWDIDKEGVKRII